MKHLVLFERFYNPPLNIKIRLEEIVKELIEEHGGGRLFFNALDSRIKDITNEDMITTLVRGCHDQWIATSGEFGDRLYKIWKDGKFKCKGIVVFNGKMLTNKIGVQNWYPNDFDLKNKKFIYVDDSYFSGSTARKIDNFLNEYKSSIKKVNVIYDGSKEKSTYVNSFFRYYN
jgi:hypothetical protein